MLAAGAAAGVDRGLTPQSSSHGAALACAIWRIWLQQTGADRDAVAHPLGGVVPLRVARHHDRLCRIDRLCRAQIVAQPGHVGGELALLAEQAGVDRDKAVADIHALRLLRVHRVGDQRRSRQARAEDIDHHRQPVALVARILRRAAERGQEAALLARLQRIGARQPLLVQDPARRALQPLIGLVADAAGGDRRRRHVEQERLPVGGRRGERPGIGAELGFLAEGRRDLDRRGAGARHADQPLLRRHQRVVAGRAEMRRVAHRGDRHAGRLGLVDRYPHREMRRHVAEPAIAIDQRRDRRFLHDPRPALHVGATVAAQPVIARDHRHAVAVDAVQIGPGQDVGGRLGVVLRHAPGQQDRLQLRPVLFIRRGRRVLRSDRPSRLTPSAARHGCCASSAR